jgi:hypothetical protein
MLRCAHFMGWETPSVYSYTQDVVECRLMRRGWYMYTRFANKQLIETFLLDT